MVFKNWRVVKGPSYLGVFRIHVYPVWFLKLIQIVGYYIVCTEYVRDIFV